MAWPAGGYVVEAQLEPGQGPTANLLVQQGTLKVGSAVVCGPYWGRVKALINDKGSKVRTAGPSTPVKCLGLTSVPEAGAEFQAVGSPREARSISDQRLAEERDASLRAPERKASLDDLMNNRDYQGGLWMMVDIDVNRLKTRSVRLNVSLPEGLLRRIDEEARSRHMSRSAFLAMTARKELEAR